MKDIVDSQTVESLDVEQFISVYRGLMQAAGAELWRTNGGVFLLLCEDGTPCTIDAPTTTVEFLFSFAMQHTIH